MNMTMYKKWNNIVDYGNLMISLRTHWSIYWRKETIVLMACYTVRLITEGAFFRFQEWRSMFEEDSKSVDNFPCHRWNLKIEAMKIFCFKVWFYIYFRICKMVFLYVKYYLYKVTTRVLKREIEWKFSNQLTWNVHEVLLT